MIDNKRSDTIEYYKAQIYKILGLFESKDVNGYRFSLKVLYEMEQLPNRYPKLMTIHEWDVILNKIDTLVDEMFFLDDDHHWLVKNFTFESMNILDEIKDVL